MVDKRKWKSNNNKIEQKSVRYIFTMLEATKDDPDVFELKNNIWLGYFFLFYFVLQFEHANVQ